MPGAHRGQGVGSPDPLDVPPHSTIADYRGYIVTFEGEVQRPSNTDKPSCPRLAVHGGIGPGTWRVQRF